MCVVRVVSVVVVVVRCAHGVGGRFGYPWGYVCEGNISRGPRCVVVSDRNFTVGGRLGVVSGVSGGVGFGPFGRNARISLSERFGGRLAVSAHFGGDRPLGTKCTPLWGISGGVSVVSVVSGGVVCGVSHTSIYRAGDRTYVL